MDSEFGQTFLFLTNLAWKCRVSLPILVTAVFMIMDIRLQIEINIQAGELAADVADVSVEDSDTTDDSWETLDSEEDEDGDSDTDNESVSNSNNNKSAVTN